MLEEDKNQDLLEISPKMQVVDIHASPRKQNASQPFQKKELMQLKPKAEDEPQDEEDSKDANNPGDPPGIPFVSQSSTTINQSKGASPRRDQL